MGRQIHCLSCNDLDSKFYDRIHAPSKTPHKDYALDFLKVKKEISTINLLSIGLADYNYINALLEANLKNYQESQINKAVGYDKEYARFPISKNVKINQTLYNLETSRLINKNLGHNTRYPLRSL